MPMPCCLRLWICRFGWTGPDPGLIRAGPLDATAGNRRGPQLCKAWDKMKPTRGVAVSPAAQAKDAPSAKRLSSQPLHCAMVNAMCPERSTHPTQTSAARKPESLRRAPISKANNAETNHVTAALLHR